MIVVSSSGRYIEMKWMLESSWSGGGGDDRDISRYFQ